MGWLEFDEEGRRYRLALRMWELGQTYMRAADLATRARPFMQQVTAELEETTQLAILDGRYNVYIAKVDGPQPLVLASQVGRRLEAHATGLGKVLLAWLSPDELLVRIGDTPLERLTKSTITSVPRLQAELAGHPPAGLRHRQRGVHAGRQMRRVPGSEPPRRSRRRDERLSADCSVQVCV